MFFLRFSTLIISISVDMCLLGSRCSRNFFFLRFFYPYQYFRRYVCLSVCWVVDLVEKKILRFFFSTLIISISVDMLGSRSSRNFFLRFFCSTLIISISIDMFVCWVVDLVEKKNFGDLFFYPYYQCFRRYACLLGSRSSRKKKFGSFFSPLISISVDMFVCLCLLGSRSSRKKI